MDRARLAYEQHSAFFPRQCVFVGTTNGQTPLKDPTGNGRYLPVRCEGFTSMTVQIDVDKLRTERDQLFAEAFHAWAAGEDVYLRDKDAIAGAHAAQDDARAEDPLDQAIDNWLSGAARSKRAPLGGTTADEWHDSPLVRDRVSVAQIACEALGFDPAGVDWPPWLSARIADHMYAREDFKRNPVPQRVPGFGKPRVFDRIGTWVTADDL